MPAVVPYDIVFERLTADGLRCVYPNGGAFRPVDESTATTVAWVGAPDATITEAARPLCRRVGEPHVPTLAKLARDMWPAVLPGPVWAMPSSHWAYELDFDSSQWLPQLLADVGIDPAPLKRTTQGAAVEFLPQDADAFEAFVGGLLNGLESSDFYLAFPGRRTVCMVHHHQQLWWTTLDRDVASSLDAMVRESSS